MKYEITTTPEYSDWLSSETLKSKAQIAKRLENIELEGHFGTTKDLGDNVLELKWLNGRRVYYGIIPEANVLLLLGGNKNGQEKDVKKAKTLFRKYIEDET